MSKRALTSPLPPRSPGRPGRPPWWFYATIGAAGAVAAALFILRSGDGAEPTFTTQPSLSPAVTPTEPPPTTASSSPSPEPTTPLGIALGGSCSDDREGYGVDFPGGWFTPSDPAWACQLFDPQPFVVEPHTEPPIVAVTVYVDRHRLPRVRRALADPSFYMVVTEEPGRFTDAARLGTILETEQIEDLLWPAGTRSFSVLVGRLDSTIVVTTNDLVGDSYEQYKQIVLAMARSLHIAG